MITFKANTRRAYGGTDDVITQYSVGIPVTIELSDEFNGLQKTLVFKNRETALDLLYFGQAVTLPHEICETLGPVSIGCYAANSQGEIVIPTIWASIGSVVKGVEPSGIDPLGPTPSWAAQVQEIASEALSASEHAVEIAETSAYSAYNSAQAAAESAHQADISAQNAHREAQDAQQSATASLNYAERAETAQGKAEEAETNAEDWADKAEQAAYHNGYMEMRIEDGHLIYERTDAVDTDFYLDAIGHLVMQAIVI